jgi:hypothetical protein
VIMTVIAYLVIGVMSVALPLLVFAWVCLLWKGFEYIGDFML